MKAALLPVQKAIYSLLTADTTLMALVSGVFDYTPENQAAPYIVIGDLSSTSWRTHDRHGEDIVLNVHVYSDYRGNKEGVAIIDRLDTLLGDITALTVTGWSFVASWFESHSVLDGVEGESRHFIATFRIRVQQE